MDVDDFRADEDVHFQEPATEDDLARAEASLGHTLPEDLRRTLTRTNGIQDTFGIDLLWNLERIVKDNDNFRTATVFADLYKPFTGLVFFSDAGNGDQFFLSLRGNNEVYVWNHEDDSRVWVASSVVDFLHRWLRGSLSI